MSYQVLARKWRSKNFAELVGQAPVVRALSHALRTNRLHHAYLLTGTRGVGKTSLARILAKALNCETGVTDTPCGRCTACIQIDDGRFIDLLEVDAASHTGIDAMRDLLENAYYAPTAGRFKVYLIDEVHMLSKSAFNAMLKTLEEPPEHVKFILATTEPQKIPITVLSRCLQFNLRPIAATAIVAHLEQLLQRESIDFEVEALRVISHAAQGSLRDALSLLDQAIGCGAGQVSSEAVHQMLGTVANDDLLKLILAVVAADGAALSLALQTITARSVPLDQALQALASLFHQIALIQTLPATADRTAPGGEALAGLATRLAPRDVQLFYQIAVHGRQELALAPDEYAGFSMTLLRMLAFAPAYSEKSLATVLPVNDKAPLTPASDIPFLQTAPAATAVSLDLDSAVSDALAWPEAPEEASFPLETEQRKLAAVPAFAAEAKKTPLEAPVDWLRLLPKLQLTGLVNMLAKHCLLSATHDSCWTFLLPAPHKALLKQQQKLATALSIFYGAPQTVQIQVERNLELSHVPIYQQEAAHQQRIVSATAQLLKDPVVQFFQTQAGARLLTETVELLDTGDSP